jgi:hypothetical protein
MGQTMDDHSPAEAGAAVQVRLNGPLFTALEDWRRRQPKLLPRSEALREILKQILVGRGQANHKPS